MKTGGIAHPPCARALITLLEDAAQEYREKHYTKRHGFDAHNDEVDQEIERRYNSIIRALGGKV